MKPEGSVVDVLLSTLDQQSPTTAKPLGRLKTLVNSVVKRYENPRAADGTVTHVSAEKRDGMKTTTNAVVDGEGNPDGVLAGAPQLVFGGGDALRQISGNRLYTQSEKWVKAIDPTGDDAVVFPHIVRSTPVYAADSQSEAPDISIIGSVTCLVWREVAQQSTANGDQAPGRTTSSALDGVRVMFRNTDGTTVRPPFTLIPTPTKVYLKVRTYAYDGVFWVLQDFSTATGTVQIDVSCFDTNGVELAVFGIGAVTNNYHWDAVTINGEGVVVAFNANGAGVKFTALRYASGTITATTNTDASIGCQTIGPCAWLTDQAMTASTGYLVTGANDDGATDLVAYRIVNLAQNHVYPIISTIGSGVWISGVAGYKDPLTTGLVVAYTLMDAIGFPEYTAYGLPHIGGGTDSCQNTDASDQYPDQLNNETHTFNVPFTGTSVGIQTRFAMSIASRAFWIGADWVAWGYYPARKWGPLTPNGAQTANNPPPGPHAPTHAPNRPADPSNFQPCWYLLPLASTQRIAGRLEYGLASADYQVLSANTASKTPAVPAILGARNRCLMHVVTTPTGALMLPLGYRAEQNIPEAALLTQQSGVDANITHITNDTFVTQQMLYSAGDTVGIKVFTLGPDSGQAFTCNQSTFIPGTMAAVVEPGEVTVSEQGILAPECPWLVYGTNVETPTPGMPAASEWFYRAVGEYTTSRGKVYRSIPSAAFAFTSILADPIDQVVFGHNMNATNKEFVKWSIYRTSFTAAQIQGGAQVTSPPTIVPAAALAASTISSFTTIFYKITNDLAPLYNAPDAKYIAGAVLPFTIGAGLGFEDTLVAATQQDGEILYTDQGFLPRYPCPAFRGGCVWQNRPWVIGYDNALWFGGELVEGQGEWFNPGFRVPAPTNEEITAVAPMDGFLLVFCANSVWYYPGGAPLPDATGQDGTIQPLVRLPFEMGCANGHTSVIRQGCLYDSSNGGVWLLTRALDNEWTGQRAQDDLAPEIIGMTIAGNFVVVNVADSRNYVMAYDTNLGAWSQWLLPTNGAVIGASKGLLVAAEDGRVWVQTPGTWVDNDTGAGVTYYVPMSLTIAAVHIGGVRSWKRTWALQLEGQTYDPCQLSVGLSYSDRDVVDHTYDLVSLLPDELEEEFRPTKQLASSIGLTITEAPPLLTKIATIVVGCPDCSTYPPPSLLPVPIVPTKPVILTSRLLGTVNNNQADLLVQTKNAYKAAGMLVGQSYDGITIGAPGVDMWPDYLAIRGASGGGGLGGAWMTMYDPVTTRQVCLYCTVSSSSTGWNEQRVVISPAAGFTGGTTTARPTATDEIVNVDSTMTAWLGTGPVGNPQFYALVWVAPDFSYIRTMWIYGGRSRSFWHWDQLQNTPTGWTKGHVLGAWKWGNTNYTVAGNRPTTSSFATNWGSGGSFKRLLLPGPDAVFSANGSLPSSPGSLYVPDQAPLANPFSGQYIWVAGLGYITTGNAAAYNGYWGNSRDIWFTVPSVFNDCDTAGDNYEYIIFNQLLLPWGLGPVGSGLGLSTPSTNYPTARWNGRNSA